MPQPSLLSAVLSLFRTESADGALIELSTPAAVRFSGDRRGYIHFALSGAAALEVTGEPDPLLIPEGGYAIVLNGRTHVLGDAPGRASISIRHFLEAHDLDAPPTLRFGGAGEGARVLTIAFQLAASARAIVRGLPDVLVGGSGARPACDAAIFNPTGAMRLLRGPGAMALITVLADLCLAQALRWALEAVPAPDGAGPILLRHPQIGAAVRLVNVRPSDDWTVAKLAHTVGMSRSSFATAFKHHVGKPPADYIAGVRMDLAATMLTAKRSLVSEVARGVGYDSDSSFIRAFKKRFGSVPSQYRRSAHGGRSA